MIADYGRNRVGRNSRTFLFSKPVPLIAEFPLTVILQLREVEYSFNMKMELNNSFFKEHQLLVSEEINETIFNYGGLYGDSN